MEVLLDINADDILHRGSSNLKSGKTRAGPTPVPAGGVSGSAKLPEDGNRQVEKNCERTQNRPIRDTLEHDDTLRNVQKCT